MSRIGRYVEQVLAIAGLPADHEQGEEIRAHLADLVAQKRTEGLGCDEAVAQALAEFGDAETVGLRLREVTPMRIGRRDWLLLAVGVIIAGSGLWLEQYFLTDRRLWWFDWITLVPILSGVLAYLAWRSAGCSACSRSGRRSRLWMGTTSGIRLPQACSAEAVGAVSGVRDSSASCSPRAPWRGHC